MMQLWLATASAIPYNDDVGQLVAGALLQIARDDTLRPHIPVLAWDWLKKRPALGYRSLALKWGTSVKVVQTVRELGDTGLLTSYLFIVWSEWTSLSAPEFTAMLQLIREKLGGIGAVRHRADLIHRLDHVLSQLRPGSSAKQYEEFRMELLGMDEEVTRTLAGMSHRAIALPVY